MEENSMIESPFAAYTVVPGPDGSMRLQSANPAFLKLLGITQEEADQPHFSMGVFIHPDDQPRMEEANLQSMRSLSPWHGFFRIVRKSGEVRLVEASGTWLKTPDGSNIGYRLLVDKTTEIPKDSRIAPGIPAVAQGNFGNQVAFAAYTITLNDDGTVKILGADQAFFELLGIAPEEVNQAGFSLANFVHPEDLVGMGAANAESIRMKSPYHVFFRLLRKNGEVRFVEALGTWHRSADGTDVGYRLLIDQSGLPNDRRQIDLTPGGHFAILSPVSGVVQTLHASDEFFAITGLSRSRLLENPGTIASVVIPADLAGYQTTCAVAHESKSLLPTNSEFCIPTRDSAGLSSEIIQSGSGHLR